MFTNKGSRGPVRNPYFSGGIDSLESIPGLPKRLQIQFQDWVESWVEPMEKPGEQCPL
jgi:hypothetical protein